MAVSKTYSEALKLIKAGDSEKVQDMINAMKDLLVLYDASVQKKLKEAKAELAEQLKGIIDAPVKPKRQRTQYTAKERVIHALERAKEDGMRGNNRKFRSAAKKAALVELEAEGEIVNVNAGKRGLPNWKLKKYVTE